MLLDKLIMVGKLREEINEENLVGESVYMNLIWLKYYASQGKGDKLEHEVSFLTSYLNSSLQVDLISNILIALTISSYNATLRNLMF